MHRLVEVGAWDVQGPPRLAQPAPGESDLRSGSNFVSLCKEHSGGHCETKREPDTNLLRNVCHPLR